MNKIKSPLIFHPIIFAIFPILSLYIRNMRLVPLSDVTIIFIVVLIIVVLLWWLLIYISNNNNKSALIVSLFFIFFFSFGQILPSFVSLLLKVGIDIRPQVLNQIGWKLWIFSLFWIGVFVILLFLIIKTKSDLKLISIFMNAVSLGLLLFSIVLSINYRLWNETKSNDVDLLPKPTLMGSISDPVHLTNAIQTEKFNIFYIILDGYAREDVLRKFYNFNNNELTNYLLERDFYIAQNSSANYAHTIHSLASSLNMDYLSEIASQMGKSSKDSQPLIRLLKSPRLIKFLADQGYTTISFETGYHPTEIHTTDHYLRSNQTLTEFQNELINLTPLMVWLRNFQHDIQRTRIEFIFNQLPSALNNNQPTFVFAHITAPHPPFVFGPNGERENPDMSYSNLDANKFTQIAGQDEYVRRYRNQVIYLNILLQDTIDKILNNSQGRAIIVVQSDHGPGSLLDLDNLTTNNYEERMPILNVYYFPDQDYSQVYPDITPVNTFRIILDQYFGTQLGLLNDRSYYSLLEQPYEFIDVTSSLSNK